MTPARTRELRSVLVETGIYGVLVACWCIAVFRWASGRLIDAARHDRPVYATLALALMVTQGLVLELLARGIVALVSPERRRSRRSRSA